MLELASIVVFGIAAQWLAWRLGVPAILPLILIGLMVGPLSTLFTHDGTKLITPVYDDHLDVGLFPGKLLFYFVSLAIGIILFEGGLTLKRSEVRGVGPVIMKLITIGSLTTFIGGALAAHFIMELNWPLSFLFSGLIIVTGPTVIAPILRNVPLNRNVSTVLKWEGILIDPIGALVAVLVFNFISTGGFSEESFSSHAFGEFSKILVIGTAIGTGMAYLLRFTLHQKLVPHYLLNVVTLAMVVFSFALSDVLVHESGLLTVVIYGMVLGNMNLTELKEILYFKESLSVLLISVLFILLSANIDIRDLERLLDWRPLALFFGVVFLLRPISVFLSTTGSNLTLNEKTFISWVGPRGIVAAGIASLFGISLTEMGVAGAEMITPLVFMIVLGTVLLNATTARWVASILGVSKTKADGVLIIGANEVGRLIAGYLQKNGRQVALVDTNSGNIHRVKQLGLEAFEGNVFSDELEDNLDFLDMGYLLAMTGSTSVNKYAVETLAKSYGENGAYRLMSADEIDANHGHLPSEVLFSSMSDFINIGELARKYPEMQEIMIDQGQDGSAFLEEVKEDPMRIPVFVKQKNGELQVITAERTYDLEEGDVISYIGQPLSTADRMSSESVKHLV